jgi:uncharacterized membrane protein (DUF485 family)
MPLCERRRHVAAARGFGHNADMSENNDITALVGAETDVAPLGRGTPKPAHELTASEDRDSVDWQAVEGSPAFRVLLAAKRRFIMPATLFFVVYYFALPLAVGFLPDFMNTRVLGSLNLAYLFALSQFVMAWILAGLYVRAAARWDRMAADIAATAPRIAGS